MNRSPFPHLPHRILFLTLTTAFAACALAGPATYAQQVENEYTQVNLVSNGYVPAKVIDHNLVNPWGMIASSTSPIWISDQGTNLSTVYTVSAADAGTGALLTVGIPTVPGVPNGPTGIVFNTHPTEFTVPGPMGPVPSLFIFSNLNGTISAWSPASKGGVANAVVVLSNQDEDDPGAVFTGLALGTVGNQDYLYAVDFRPNHGITVLNKSFERASGFGPGAFMANDQLPALPAGLIWAPYNIVNLNGMMYVAYVAMPAQGGLPVTHQGFGAVAVFTPAGQLVKVFARKGQLDTPWGMTMASSHFGRFSNDLLVGNFGNGQILAFRPDGGYAGTLRGENHQPLRNGFLWTLMFGNGAHGSDPNTLYITTGGGNQATDGLFAAIAPAK